MAWIESHQELANHPKTGRLAHYLGIGKPQAVGHLHFLWWYALSYAEDGDLSDLSDLIAYGASWDGDEEVFVAALIKSGFLDEDYQLHDWMDYAGKLVERREQDRERKRRSRVLHKSGLAKRIKERDQGLCRYCGIEVNWRDKRGGRGGVYEHVVPFPEGDESYDNIVVSCKRCNVQKGNRTPEEAGMALLLPGTKSGSMRNQTGTKSDLQPAPQSFANPTQPNPTGPNPTQPEEGDKSPRKRDELWEVFIQIHGEPASKSERGKFNKIVAQLREAQVTPVEYPSLVAAYVSKYGGSQPAAATVANRVGEMRNYAAKGPMQAPDADRLRQDREWAAVLEAHEQEALP